MMKGILAKEKSDFSKEELKRKKDEYHKIVNVLLIAEIVFITGSIASNSISVVTVVVLVVMNLLEGFFKKIEKNYKKVLKEIQKQERKNMIATCMKKINFGEFSYEQMKWILEKLIEKGDIKMELCEDKIKISIDGEDIFVDRKYYC